ncbi:FtsX-like permease family protein [Micromonospora craniellae]|uniref:FtsX-like permease family protein n=1 Tax=Micromonospora craniellae TaxID=2294034 RepID=UPI001CC57C68|nr:FtsX-like permease family protein [Micromonospora craniellae]
MISAWLFVVSAATSLASDERIAAREPVFVENSGQSAAVARWMIHADSVDNKQFLVLYISPLRNDAMPPPGLPRWPKPGESFFSPELLKSANAQEFTQRYGEFGGVIEVSGLATATERLVYHRPPTDTPFDNRDGLVAISGFGVDPSSFGRDYFPSTVDGFGKWTVSDIYILILAVIALPAALLLFLAVRSNSERRDRRLAMLDALGAPASSRAWVLVGEALVPVFLGAIAGFLVALATTYFNIRVPITGYLVRSADVDSARRWIPALAIGSVALAIFLVVATQLRRAARGETRPRHLNPRFRRWLQSAFPVAVALSIWGAATARDGGARYSPGLIVFLFALLGTLISLPAVLGAGSALLGRAVARLGRVASSPGLIIGGRWLNQRPMMVARLCAAFVVGLGLLVQVQVQQAWIVQQARGLANGVAPQALTVGDSLLILRTQSSPAEGRHFGALVGPDKFLRVAEIGGVPTLVGTCVALKEFGELRTCPGATAQNVDSVFDRFNLRGNLLRGGTLISAPDFKVTTDLDADGSTSGYFVINDEMKIGATKIANAAYATLSKPYVSTPGQEWITGGLAGAAVFNWVLALGALGLIILALAGALATSGMFLTNARSLGVVGTYDTRLSLYLGIATWNLGIPLLFAGAVGSGVAAFLGVLTLHIRRVGSVSMEVLGAGFGTVALLAALLTVLCGIGAARSAQTWRPVAD